MRAKYKHWLLLGFIGLSTPLALVAETGVRALVLPPEWEEVRAWLRPELTRWMWLMPILSLTFTGVGIRLRRWLTQRALKRIAASPPSPNAVYKAEFDALMLATSAPQVPALVSTIGLMSGSALPPVVATIAVSTLGVLVVGWKLDPPEKPSS